MTTRGSNDLKYLNLLDPKVQVSSITIKVIVTPSTKIKLLLNIQFKISYYFMKNTFKVS